MKTLLILMTTLLLPAVALAEETKVLYARCNIRLHDEKITQENWLADPVGISAGTKIISAKREKGEEFTFRITLEDGRKFKMPEEWAGKYIQDNLPALDVLPPEFKYAVKNAEPAIGMTKEQVSFSMCVPAYTLIAANPVMKRADGMEKTEGMPLAEIMKKPFWVYQRKRFGKKLVVEFGEDGLVKKVFWWML